MLAQDAAAGGLEAHPGAGGRAGLYQRFLAHKLLFAKLDGKVQAGLQRRDGLVHLVAVKGHRGLQAQGVAGAQAAGDAAQVGAGLAQGVPDGGRVGGGGVDLVA